jgi:hypothetical protein
MDKKTSSSLGNEDIIIAWQWIKRHHHRLAKKIKDIIIDWPSEKFFKVK